MSKKIDQLTGLRAIAIIIVFISHAANTGLIPAVFGKGFGQLGVMIFFVLSGFLMGYLYLSRDFDRNNVTNYIAARIGRVIPLYLLVVLLSFVISKFIYPEFRYQITNGIDLMRHLLFIEGDFELWTIPVEVQFYAIFIAFWYLYKRTESIPLLILFAGLTLVPTAVTMLFYNRYFHIVSSYSFAFFIGVFTPLFISIEWLRTDARVKRVLNITGIIFLILVFADLPQLRIQTGLYVVNNVLALTWFDPVTWLLIYGLFLSCVVESSSLKILESRPIQFLGEISYAFYLLHYPILKIAAKITFLPSIVNVILVFIIVVWLSHLSLKYFELPANTFMKKLIKERLTAEPKLAGR